MRWFSVVAIVVVVDRLTKVVAVTLPQLNFVLLPGLLTFNPNINPHGPFGLPLGNTVMLALGALVFLALLGGVLTARSERERLLLSTVAYGVFSNALDRFQFGFVVDALHMLGGLSFNIADIAIVCGVGLTLVDLIIRSREHRGEAST